MEVDRNSESKLKGARVLIVEDDEHYAEWIELALLELGVSQNLQGNGWRIGTQADGERARVRSDRVRLADAEDGWAGLPEALSRKGLDIDVPGADREIGA